MNFWTLDRLDRALQSDIVGARPLGSQWLGDVSTDTRTLRPGDVFVALQGERFDGHDFLEVAARSGASALVVRDPRRAAAVGIPVFVVGDTSSALLALGRFRRRAWGGQVVTIAGSNGKSSTKEMTRAALATRYVVHATEGNLNNFVGVPLTLLAIPDSAQVAVIEIGTNRPGEVATLRAVAEPDIAVVTSIGEEHLEGLGDLAGVLAEETAVFHGAPLAIAPAVQAEVGAAARTMADRVVEAGLDEGDVRPDRWGLEVDGQVCLQIGETRAVLPFRGVHHARNAMLAVAVSRALGMDDADALHGMVKATPLPMRGAFESFGTLTVVNDAYNANPASAREALSLLDALDLGGGRPRVIVLGSMLELGRQSEALHREVAVRALATSATIVAGMGAFAPALAEAGHADPRVVVADDVDALWAQLRTRLPLNAIVLLKGSRGVRLERLLPMLREFAGVGPTPRPSDLR
ncbi:MAG: UDP-N-acetylmuramoyl-tripeptide--D-alanyl-D-alanine ligase [Gemmatimonadaceae bacterium]|nr:UDP-N-acetylmuramoyl-tripeptide--D-alanyl-D-alanine ligase [Gemmatimonadaceae bacterium]